MAEAVISIRLTPTEFDLLRRAISDAGDANARIAMNASLEPSVKQAARQEEAQLKELERKFK